MRKASLLPSQRPLLLLVHGTFDGSPPSKDGTPTTWWHAGSPLDQWLSGRILTPSGQLLSDGVDIDRFTWSGENTEASREKGAAALCTSLESHLEKGRVIHIVAHSHGGNVVRRSLEFLTRDSGLQAQSIYVYSFGAPFFHYRLPVFQLLSQFTLAWLPLAVAVAASSYIKAFGVVAYAICLAWAYFLLRNLVTRTLRSSAYFGLRKSRIERLKNCVRWINYTASKDEALALLSSFNQTLRLMRKDSADTILAANVPWLTLAPFLVIAMLAAMGNIAAWIATLHGAQNMFATWVVAILSLPVGISVIWLIGWVFAGYFFLVDRTITDQARTFAFGDDGNAGIKSVQCYPWVGFEGAHQPLPPETEVAMETHVAQNSTGLWASLRRRYDAASTLLTQDIGKIVQNTLSFNELAHTSYTRIEPFADVLAKDILESGHWLPAHTEPSGQPRVSA